MHLQPAYPEGLRKPPWPVPSHPRRAARSAPARGTGRNQCPHVFPKATLPCPQGLKASRRHSGPLASGKRTQSCTCNHRWDECGEGKAGTCGRRCPGGARPYLGGKEASRTRHHRRGEVANEQEKTSPQGEGRGGAQTGALRSQRWREQQVGAEPHEMGQG